MSDPKPVIVRGDDGLLGVVARPDDLRDPSGPWIAVDFDGDRRVLVPRELLIPQGDASYRLALRAADLGQPDAPDRPASTEAVIPVIREEVEVETRRVETGRVRVRKVVREREEAVDVPLIQEQVEVIRVPVGRIVDARAPARQEGDTWIVPLYEEVVVVEKRLRLREELHIARKRTETPQSQLVTLRDEEAVVERLPVRDEDRDRS